MSPTTSPEPHTGLQGEGGACRQRAACQEGIVSESPEPPAGRLGAPAQRPRAEEPGLSVKAAILLAAPVPAIMSENAAAAARMGVTNQPVEILTVNTAEIKAQEGKGGPVFTQPRPKLTSGPRFSYEPVKHNHLPFGASPNDGFFVRTTWDGSARLRFGWLINPSTMLYLTGGLAWAHLEAMSSCSEVPTPNVSNCAGGNYFSGTLGPVNVGSIK
jgi:hypothetical protein